MAICPIRELKSNTGSPELFPQAGGVRRQIGALQYHGADVGVLLQALAQDVRDLIGDGLQLEFAPVRIAVQAAPLPAGCACSGGPGCPGG